MSRVRFRLRRQRLGVMWERMVLSGEDLGGHLADFLSTSDLSAWARVSRECARTVSSFMKQRLIFLGEAKNGDLSESLLAPHQQLFVAMALAAVRMSIDKDEQRLQAKTVQQQMLVAQKQKKQAHQIYVARQCATQPPSHDRRHISRR